MVLALNSRSGTQTKLRHTLLDTEIAPEIGVRLKQSQSVSFREKRYFYLWTNDLDINPDLTMVFTATILKDIPRG